MWCVGLFSTVCISRQAPGSSSGSTLDLINDFKNSVWWGPAWVLLMERGSVWLLLSTAGKSQAQNLNQDFGGRLRADKTVSRDMQSLNQSGALLWTLRAASACGHQGSVSVTATLPRGTTGSRWWETKERPPL